MIQFVFKLVMVQVMVSVLVTNAALYVSPQGSDGGDGTINKPFASWEKAQAAVSSGDTVFFRSGTYKYTKSASPCNGQSSKVSVIVLSKSGSSGKLIHYFNYPGEHPVLDFYGMKNNCRMRAFEVRGSWIHMKGFEITGLPQTNNKNNENWGIIVSGSNNIFELLDIHHIMGAGLFITNGTNNLILNCDSHDNYDMHSSKGKGGSADGFGDHTNTVSAKGNTFRGCRAWWNTDDGFDCIHCNSPVVIENCWNFLNGYKPGTSTKIGDGNGFKVGGFDMPPRHVPSKIPANTVRNSLSFLNRASGFYQNHHMVPNVYHNNTAYNNNVTGFKLLGCDPNSHKDVNMGILRNNVVLGGKSAVTHATGSMVDAKNNSWDLSMTVTESDFLSVDTAGVFGPRKEDGSLPDIDFLRLSPGSKLIDKGVDIGLPFKGSKPDLGAYELGSATNVRKRNLSATINRVYRGQVQFFDVSGRKIPVGHRNNYIGAMIYLVRLKNDHHHGVIANLPKQD